MFDDDETDTSHTYTTPNREYANKTYLADRIMVGRENTNITQMPASAKDCKPKSFNEVLILEHSSNTRGNFVLSTVTSTTLPDHINPTNARNANVAKYHDILAG